MTKSPFFGVYYNQAGELIDMFTGQAVNAADLVPKMTPFFGVFLDAAGNRHDLSELGGNTGAATTAAQVSVSTIHGLTASSVQQALSEIMAAQIAPLWQTVNAAAIDTTVINQPFTNATFSGEVNAIAVKLRKDVTIVSFWGFANQNAAGTPAQDFVMLDPGTYPLLERFVGQVDQFAIGYNAATNDFKYVPIRITSQGMFIVTAPNISVGTRFSYQFVLILAETETE